MNRSDKSRTETCDSSNARHRLREAEVSLEVATVTQVNGPNDEAYGGVATSLAVQAGIAATDAACCHQLKRRSRSQNHRDAAVLAAKIEPGGKVASKRLLKLLDVKDKAQYGFVPLGESQVKSAIRNAEQLVEWAKTVLAG